jgi:lipoteichoic acid synthase
MMTMSGREKRDLIYYLFFPVSLFYMEMVLKVYCFNVLIDKGFWYTLLFTVVIGLIVAILCSVWSQKTNRIVSIILMLLFTLIIGVQTVYYTIFSTFTTLFSVSDAGEVLGEFWKDALLGIWHSIIPLIFVFIPLIFLIAFGKRFLPEKKLSAKYVIVIAFAACVIQLSNVLLIYTDDEGIMSTEYVYSEVFSPVLAVPRFGVLTTTRLDIMNLFRGEVDVIDTLEEMDKINLGAQFAPIDTETPDRVNATPAREDADTVKYNVMDIDFDQLISETDDQEIIGMHEYFAAATPSKKNEYTGMFEGKNLIWIVAEGFSSFALDADHTPTLCRLSQEGFVFNNFYNPIWGVSTSDGEYVTTTGLIPKAGVWSYSRSSDNLMPFAFGNQFSERGYSARAYHDHTYTYYDRESSHPNMGYVYKGVGNGLEITDQWPESDVEMMQVSIPEYINDDAFMVYYMTVSGHLHYNFMGNAMSIKHEQEVADLPYSEGPRAYIACNMEFDQSVEYLLEQLNAAGVLDDTVIVISGDHYPYGLDISEMEEIYGGPLDTSFEMYKSTLIIWTPDMETVTVDKYCSSLDIMPTLSNLFGLEYDSRLVMGRDILSDSEPLVVFYDHSYITERGRYDASIDTFIPSNGQPATEEDNEYAKQMMEVVNGMFSYSEKVLDNDYYRIVFGDTEKISQE